MLERARRRSSTLPLGRFFAECFERWCFCLFDVFPGPIFIHFGAGQDTATFTDDIVLDTTSPVVEGAEEDVVATGELRFPSSMQSE